MQAPVARGQLVLVVDDSASMRQMIRFSLEDAGFAVEEAPDGRVALERLAALPNVACALLDLNMPVMGGLELIRAIRGSERHRHLPVIVLSKDDQIARREEALESGATGYLVKPFIPEHLVKTLQLVAQ